MLLLLAFVTLGTSAYSLAVSSPSAWIFAAATVVLFAASVAGFRMGARQRALSNHSGIDIDDANIWARPLRREQIDHYLRSYRRTEDGALLRAVAKVPTAPTTVMDRRAA
jgi:hypothetical protein